MENQPAVTTAPVEPAKRKTIFERVQNPVILKELRGRMRGRSAVILLTGYLALIGLIVGMIYISMAQESMYSFNSSSEFRQGIGKAIFFTVVLLELFMVSLIGPALTAGAIASERERQTFEVLRTTTLSARSLVLGKLGAALAYLLLLIAAAAPIESVAFFLGGVGLEEILVSTLLLAITAVFYCALGLYFSSFMKRTTGANVASYVSIILSYILLFVVFYTLTMIEINSTFSSGSSYSSSVTNTPFESFLNVLMWTLISINPLLTAIMSEVVLVEDQSLWLTSQRLFGSHDTTFPSPWIIYTIVYVLLSILMIYLSIRRVNRPEK